MPRTRRSNRDITLFKIERFTIQKIILLASQSPWPAQTQRRQNYMDSSALLTALRAAETASQQTRTLHKGLGRALCVNCSERLWSGAGCAQLCLLNCLNV